MANIYRDYSHKYDFLKLSECNYPDRYLFHTSYTTSAIYNLALK